MGYGVVLLLPTSILDIRTTGGRYYIVYYVCYIIIFHKNVDSWYLFLFVQRRGAISYDSSDQTALYIRMLGKYFLTFIV